MKKASFIGERGFKNESYSPLISQKGNLSVGISTVPYGISGAKSAPFHNGITVGCWASQGQIPQPALDKSYLVSFECKLS